MQCFKIIVSYYLYIFFCLFLVWGNLHPCFFTMARSESPPPFFWLAFAWYLFFHAWSIFSHAFNLSALFYLNSMSCRHHTVGSFFKKKKNPVYLSLHFNWGIRPFTLNTIINTYGFKSIILLFVFLVSHLQFNPFFLPSFGLCIIFYSVLFLLLTYYLPLFI